SRSPMEIFPPLTSSRPAIIRSSVDLPHPDGPTRTRNSPLSTSRSTPSTARTPPLYSFTTASRVIRDIVSLLALTAAPIIWHSRPAVNVLFNRFQKSFAATAGDRSHPCHRRPDRRGVRGLGVTCAERDQDEPRDRAARDGGSGCGRLRPERRRTEPSLPA